jgi:uncharacterized protein YggE
MKIKQRNPWNERVLQNFRLLKCHKSVYSKTSQQLAAQFIGAYMNYDFFLGMKYLTVTALFVAANICYGEPPHPQKNPANSITTTGECIAKVAHDRGAITITSTATAASAQQASTAAIAAHVTLKNAVKNLRLKDFYAESVEYSVHQDCSYNKGKRTCSGFNARMGTRFETSEIDRLGDVIRVSSDKSAEESSRLETFASPQSIQRARENCLEQAMRNATDKAKRIARGADVQLGKLLYVKENPSSSEATPSPIARRGLMEMTATAAKSPTIEAKPLEIYITVTGDYEIIR